MSTRRRAPVPRPGQRNSRRAARDHLELESRVRQRIQLGEQRTEPLELAFVDELRVGAGDRRDPDQGAEPFDRRSIRGTVNHPSMLGPTGPRGSGAGGGWGSAGNRRQRHPTDRWPA